MGQREFHVDDFGARGDNNTASASRNVTAFTNAYAAASDGIKIVFGSGRTYYIDDTLVVNKHNTIIDLNGATLRATSWAGAATEGMIDLQRDSGDELNNIKIINGSFNLGDQACHGISNLTDFASTFERRFKFAYFGNLDFNNNAPGQHMVALRHAENKCTFEHCEFDKVDSTNANKSAGLYLTNNGADAGNTNISNCKFSCAAASIQARLLWVDHVDNPFVRLNLNGNHFFANQANNPETQKCHGIYVDLQDAGGDWNNRWINIHHNSIEDMWKGIYLVATGGGSGGRGIFISDNHIENKNDGKVAPNEYETDNVLIYVGNEISCTINNNLLYWVTDDATATETFTGIDVATNLPVYCFDNEFKKRQTNGVLNKFSSASIAKNTVTIGHPIVFTGFTPLFSGITTNRYVPVGGHSTEFSSRTLAEMTVRRPLLLRQIAAKPHTNSLTQNTPINLLKDGTTLATLTIPNTASTAEQAAYISAYQIAHGSSTTTVEILPGEKICFEIDFQGTETGSLRLASLIAWCEEIKSG